MNMITWIVVWQVVGALSLLFLGATVKNGFFHQFQGWEFVNPYWCYKFNTNVNIIGALMLALMFTAICPAGAVCYWFYKLCTFGRRKK